jgi:hypothetical protein
MLYKNIEYLEEICSKILISFIYLFLIAARMFDYIDTGMMEGLQHRLLTFTQQQLKNVTTEEEELEISQGNHVALRSKVNTHLILLLVYQCNST